MLFLTYCRKMENNYYKIQNKNMRDLNKNARKKSSGSSTKKHTTTNKRKSGKKRKNKRLNYKKIFTALVILAILIGLPILIFYKLLPKIFSNANKPQPTQQVAATPQDVTINMAVVRRYNVSLNQF